MTGKRIGKQIWDTASLLLMIKGRFWTEKEGSDTTEWGNYEFELGWKEMTKGQKQLKLLMAQGLWSD